MQLCTYRPPDKYHWCKKNKMNIKIQIQIRINRVIEIERKKHREEEKNNMRIVNLCDKNETISKWLQHPSSNTSFTQSAIGNRQLSFTWLEIEFRSFYNSIWTLNNGSVCDISTLEMKTDTKWISVNEVHICEN